MRITIDLEPHELAVANELISNLKSLTDQLHIRQTNGSTVTASGTAASSSEGASRDAAAAAAPPPVVQQAAAPLTTPAAALPPRAASSEANGHVHLAPEKRTTSALILLTLTDPSQIDSVADQLSVNLGARSDTNAGINELVDAFEAVVFPPHTPGSMPDVDRVERYFQLLANKLPDKFNTEFRKGVLQRVLRHLTRAREPTSDRTEVVPFAVAFSALARLECVKIGGALQTIERLMGKDNNRSAAITMLGFTLSSCPQLVATAPRDVIDAVWAAVDKLAEKHLPDTVNDMEYINTWRNMWRNSLEPPANLPYNPLGPSTYPPPSGPAQAPGLPHVATAAPDTGGALQAPGDQGSGSQALVLGSVGIITMNAPGQCMAWDAASACAVVSCTDGGISAWQVSSNRETARLEVPGYAPAGCISTHASRGQMLLAANPVQQPHGGTNGGAYLALHSTMPSLPRRGVAVRPHGVHITSTLLLPHDESTCISCESWPAHMGGLSVCLWDITRFSAGAPAPSGSEEMRPLFTYTDGHTDTITCSAAAPDSQQVFFTGGNDGVVRVWDTRMRQAAGYLAVQDGRGKAHAGAVTAMDASDHTLITAGSDAHVCMFDVRQLGNPNELHPTLNMVVETPGVPIYKLAFNNSPSSTMAALASGSGLYLLDWTDSTNPTMTHAPGYHGASSMALFQHDICWAPGAAPGGGLGLLGLCSQPTMTVFSLRLMDV